MFQVLWHGVLPVIVFILCYWRIIVVVRRHTKVRPTNLQLASTAEAAASHQPAGASLASPAAADEEGNSPASAVATGAGGQKISRSEMNVLKTMCFVTVAYIVCWLPLCFYYLLKVFQVCSQMAVKPDVWWHCRAEVYSVAKK